MSRADRFTATSVKEEIYSDFLVNFNAHPVSGTLLRFVNEVAVSRSIRNLMLTNTGERLYQPDVGSGIRAFLFEPISEVTSIALRGAIEYTIRSHEPRARVLRVSVVTQEERNAYGVTVVYMLINKSDPISVNVTLQRVR